MESLHWHETSIRRANVCTFTWFLLQFFWLLGKVYVTFQEERCQILLEDTDVIRLETARSDMTSRPSSWVPASACGLQFLLVLLYFTEMTPSWFFDMACPTDSKFQHYTKRKSYGYYLTSFHNCGKSNLLMCVSYIYYNILYILHYI